MDSCLPCRCIPSWDSFLKPHSVRTHTSDLSSDTTPSNLFPLLEPVWLGSCPHAATARWFCRRFQPLVGGVLAWQLAEVLLLALHSSFPWLSSSISRLMVIQRWHKNKPYGFVRHILRHQHATLPGSRFVFVRKGSLASPLKTPSQIWRNFYWQSRRGGGPWLCLGDSYMLEDWSLSWLVCVRVAWLGYLCVE